MEVFHIVTDKLKYIFSFLKILLESPLQSVSVNFSSL